MIYQHPKQFKFAIPYSSTGPIKGVEG
jgi:hypothetical protein